MNHTSALVLAAGYEKQAIFYLGQFSTWDTRTAFQSEPNFHQPIFARKKTQFSCMYISEEVSCAVVKSLEACQHQTDLIPKRPILLGLLPVLEPELIRFTVTSFQLNNHGSPNSGSSEVRSPNSSLQGLTLAA